MMRTSSGIAFAVGGAMLFAVACSFGGTQENKQPDAGGSVGATCGDGVCAASEVGACAADCGTGMHGSGSGSGSGSSTQAICGNGTCEVGENITTCPSDCSGGGSGSGSGSGTLNCSDPNTIIVCLPCIIDPTQCVGVTQADCQACLGGP